MRFSLLKNQQSHGKEPGRGTISLAGRQVAYTVKRSDRARYIRLQVGVETGLEVVVPRKFNLKDLDDILRKKQKWILDKLGYGASADENGPLSRPQGGGRVLYCGREYEVEARVKPGSAPKVAVGENKLVVTVPVEAEGSVRLVLEHWFRHRAREMITKRLREISEQLNLSYNRVFIKDQKTRWGSCSQKRNLNFNWRLAMAPPQVQDYVIVHELMHLMEPNHSKRFWALVEEVCPDYKAHRAWLRKNGRQLLL